MEINRSIFLAGFQLLLLLCILPQESLQECTAEQYVCYEPKGCVDALQWNAQCAPNERKICDSLRGEQLCAGSCEVPSLCSCISNKTPCSNGVGCAPLGDPGECTCGGDYTKIRCPDGICISQSNFTECPDGPAKYYRCPSTEPYCYRASGCLQSSFKYQCQVR